jgi:hypothetical protein
MVALWAMRVLSVVCTVTVPYRVWSTRIGIEEEEGKQKHLDTEEQSWQAIGKIEFAQVLGRLDGLSAHKNRKDGGLKEVYGDYTLEGKEFRHGPVLDDVGLDAPVEADNGNNGYRSGKDLDDGDLPIVSQTLAHLRQ